jgi:hypothetical protein
MEGMLVSLRTSDQLPPSVPSGRPNASIAGVEGNGIG